MSQCRIGSRVKIGRHSIMRLTASIQIEMVKIQVEFRCKNTHTREHGQKQRHMQLDIGPTQIQSMSACDLSIAFTPTHAHTCTGIFASREARRRTTHPPNSKILAISSLLFFTKPCPPSPTGHENSPALTMRLRARRHTSPMYIPPISFSRRCCPGLLDAASSSPSTCLTFRGCWGGPWKRTCVCVCVCVCVHGQNKRR
jgi:hypothetical protein